MLTALTIHYTFAPWALLLPVVSMKAFDAMAQALLGRVGSFEVILVVTESLILGCFL